jgi:hypothetical protein
MEKDPTNQDDLDKSQREFDAELDNLLEDETSADLAMENDEKLKKIEKIEKEIEIAKNELATSEGKMASVKKESVRNKIAETIKQHKENIEKMEFERDMLGAENVDSIEDIKGEKAQLKKIAKKSQKATVIDSGELFEAILTSDNLASNCFEALLLKVGQWLAPGIKSLR